MTPSPLCMGKIDYINASPVYYGLDHGLLPGWITLVPRPPAVLNAMMEAGTIDMGPVSAAFYGMHHSDLLVLPDLSIASHGEVMSVILMSNYPLNQLHGRQVMLSQESATSACLVRLMMAQTHQRPRFTTGRLKGIKDVPGDVDAAMIIGDAAMNQPWEERFRYRFDLGQEWFNSTGHPFVYALWVVQRSYARQHPATVAAAVDLLHQSRAVGYRHMDKVVQAGARKLGLDTAYVERYFNHLLCNLDVPKVKGLSRFFDALYGHGIFDDPVDICFFTP